MFRSSVIPVASFQAALEPCLQSLSVGPKSFVPPLFRADFRCISAITFPFFPSSATSWMSELGPVCGVMSALPFLLYEK